MKKSIPYLLFLLILCFSCSSDSSTTTEPEIEVENPPDNTPTYETSKIPQTSQRSGNATKGYEYLINGDYMSSGIPYDIFILGNGTDNSNILNRTGENATIPYDFNAIDAANGVKIVAPNCMQCHATQINNELVIGLGNQTLDFTVNRADQINTLNAAITILHGRDSEEWEAYEPFKKSLETVGPKTITNTRGVNPADKTTLVLTAYRDKNTLEQLDNAAITISNEVIPSDVPAWWLLKKKNALFYHAIGREDFCRSMITMVLATLTDFDKAEEVDGKMKDILEYIKTIEPPKYPFTIDTNLANQGETIFKNNCATCHGTYGGNDFYPNLLVSLKTVGTDPELSNFYTNSSPEMEYFKDWFNTGWFGSGSNGMKLVAEGGYVAPPLDGVWATAPYFHNASVPTVDDVLNSTKRPKYWTRTFVSTDYDETKVGWNYTVQNSKVDKNTYDTTQKGYGNSGHTFGDNLTSDERKAVIEYLKTL
jgi:mono/diheme cytochrome c family protein